jgi:hypothetical protein
MVNPDPTVTIQTTGNEATLVMDSESTSESRANDPVSIS